MGFNTTVVILNDGLGAIREDAKFGEKLADAIANWGVNRDRLANTLHSGNGNVGEVVETHHADGTAVIAVGGNCGTLIGFAGGYTHHKPEDKLRIVQALAFDLGYTLTKKRKKKWQQT